MEIRDERPGDIAAIRELNRQSFGQHQEGDIVDALRANGGATLSLVATVDERVAGHILYSPVSIGDVMGAGLGPMAVLPERQRQGIGGQLVQAGNRKLQEAGCPFIVVLGHPAFYPRFGFRPASASGITCEWPVPDDVFMVLVLDPPRMRNLTGLAKYRSEFSTIE